MPENVPDSDRFDWNIDEYNIIVDKYHNILTINIKPKAKLHLGSLEEIWQLKC